MGVASMVIAAKQGDNSDNIPSNTELERLTGEGARWDGRRAHPVVERTDRHFQQLGGETGLPGSWEGRLAYSAVGKHNIPSWPLV